MNLLLLSPPVNPDDGAPVDEIAVAWYLLGQLLCLACQVGNVDVGLATRHRFRWHNSDRHTGQTKKSARSGTVDSGNTPFELLGTGIVLRDFFAKAREQTADICKAIRR